MLRIGYDGMWNQPQRVLTRIDSVALCSDTTWQAGDQT